MSKHTITDDQLTDDQVRAFAVAGAMQEAQRIFSLFPEVRAHFLGNGSKPDAWAPVLRHHAATVEGQKPTGRHMSDQQKAAVSKRMKKYWQQRRAAAGRS